MKLKFFLIDQSKIKVHYIDIPVSEPQHFSSPSQQKLSRLFNTIGTKLKTPLVNALSFGAKGKHLTPGLYHRYANYSFIDNIIRNILSCYYYTLGFLGIILFALPAVVGILCQMLGAYINLPEYEYRVTNKKVHAPEQREPLQFVTRNLALLPMIVTNFANLRPADERINEIISSILYSPKAAKLDFICLQEVFGDFYNKKLVVGLQHKFKYFIYNIAPGSVGLGSGLFFASNKKIIDARFIRPPLPFFNKANNFMQITTSIESMSHKGILYVLIQNGKEYDIVINAHIKSNIGFDHIETESIEKTRAKGLRVLAQGLFEYIDTVEEKFDIKVNHVFIGGDLNVSDKQECGDFTFERSGMKEGVRVRHGERDLSFIYEGLFPSPPIETWLMDEKEPNSEETGFGQKNHTNEDVLPGICFDHAGIFTYRESIKRLVPEVSRFDDQGYSQGQGSPSSDHAGLLLVAK